MSDQASSYSIQLENEEETVRWANFFGPLLQSGHVIALDGNLGAGKTRLVKAIAESLGLNGDVVSSPTYTIVQSYFAKIPLHHFDLYRILDEDELYDSGCDEFFEQPGICFVEWASLYPHFLPEDHLAISIKITGETSRELTMNSTGDLHNELMVDLREWGH